ncbi:RNA polymerase sigma factor [Massilia sp. Leaf139]|uniref:RNA polymerase sigma factor n=1 Tax=Massilia sp. Leaf139 TaxID=1736272 RepID=UPI00070235CA|nr:RNA polymerase sigma factor [Massilia sp. Leaf139]KQQ86454.1 RNA polymerase subunit sigma-70 [Massilia sp. Leaf139]
MLANDIAALLPRMRRFARSLTFHREDADDLVQLALERALGRSEQYSAGTRLDSWLFRIVRNAWVDEVRSRVRRSDLFAPEEEGEQVGHDAIEAHQQRMAVQKAMSMLSEEHRVVVALVLVDGLPYKEAAQVLDIPLGTLTSRLARAREALQTLLQDEARAAP